MLGETGWAATTQRDALALVFAVSFTLRFTAPVLLAFAGFSCCGRWRETKAFAAGCAAYIAAVAGSLRSCSFASTPMRFSAVSQQSRCSSSHGPTKAECC